MRIMGMGLAACLLAVSAFCAQFSAAPAGKSPDESPPAAAPAAAILDSGFRELYELNFKGARGQFLSYQKAQPDDPMGKAAEAASYLFEQFNAKGVFTSEFFLNDSKFLGGAAGSAAQNRNDAFLNANESARGMAKEQLKSNPNDAHALLVLTMTDGMEADYDAMIVKKQMAGLGLTRQAEAEATKLLAIDPSAEDAYLALGTANYIIGSLPGFKRAFLWIGGMHGDRSRGIEQLQRTADHGHYLQPFAKILLALAYEREHQMDHARVLLADLATQFPANPVFARELALIDDRGHTP